MNDLYDYFCLAAGQHHVQIFHEPERKKFAEDCDIAMANYERCQRRKREYTPRFTTSNAPVQMQEDVLRMFAGGYNTLYDSAICWIDPTDQALFDAVDGLEDAGIEITEEEFVKFFNAWIINICDSATALGHTISDEVRLNVRPSYGGYGLDKDWNFSKNMRDIMGWKEDSTEAAIWRRIDEGQNLVIIGKCDTGKTTLAAHIGQIALRKKETVYYCNIEEFLRVIKNKDKSRKTEIIYRYMLDCSVIIVDDVMYANIMPEDLPLFYRAVSFFNEERSLIIITNRELSGWISAAEDTHLMQTLVDRITADSQIIRL